MSDDLRKRYADAISEEAEQAAGEAESAPGTYWERAVLERFVLGGPVDLKTVRQQVAVLLGETRRRDAPGNRPDHDRSRWQEHDA